MTTDKTTMKIERSTRQTLKHIVRKDQTYDEIVKERIKCDAKDCNAAGINKIEVGAGKFGTVTLFLCPNCIGNFRIDKTN